MKWYPRRVKKYLNKSHLFKGYPIIVPKHIVEKVWEDTKNYELLWYKEHDVQYICYAFFFEILKCIKQERQIKINGMGTFVPYRKNFLKHNPDGTKTIIQDQLHFYLNYSQNMKYRIMDCINEDTEEYREYKKVIHEFLKSLGNITEERKSLIEKDGLYELGKFHGIEFEEEDG